MPIYPPAWRQARWKGFSEDPARITSRAGDRVCGSRWSPQTLVGMAGAVPGCAGWRRQGTLGELSWDQWQLLCVHRVGAQLAQCEAAPGLSWCSSRAVISLGLGKGPGPAEQPSRSHCPASRFGLRLRRTPSRVPCASCTPRWLQGAGLRDDATEQCSAPALCVCHCGNTRGGCGGKGEEGEGRPAGQLGSPEAAAPVHPRQVVRVGSSEGAWRQASGSAPPLPRFTVALVR